MLFHYTMLFLLGSLIGAACFFLLPLFKPDKSIGDKFIWLAVTGMHRATLSMQEEGNLHWKKLQYDSSGPQKVKIRGETITLSDPAKAIKSFKGKSLALSDEIHGVIFRVSDALAGKQREIADAQNRMVNGASDSEKKEHNLYAWVRKYLRIPVNEPADLTNVRKLATGNERGTDPKTVDKYFKFSRIHELSKTSIWKILLPVVTYIGVFVIIQQFTGSGGGGSSAAPAAENGTTVSLLLLTPWIGKHKRALSIVGIFSAVVISAYLMFGYVYALLPVFFALGIIVGLVGMTIVITGLCILKVGGFLSTMLLDLGLRTYEYPTITETKNGYELKEGDGTGVMHRLGKHELYFTVSASGIVERKGYAGTGEYIIDNEPDTDHKVATKRLTHYGWYIPKYIQQNAFYITSTDALQSLAAGFIGNDTNEKHQDAKEEYGDGDLGANDTTIIASVFIALLLAIATAMVL